ncbi:MAG: RluA family pseudouridine synthase [Chitinophagales bacterium]|jgi:23S rRNA pseudouridine1911/1915/1917 synthase|nr:RluA family pseudouridine synthase [Chitinophagales bacterium]
MINETKSDLLTEEDDLLMEDEQSWYEHLRRVVDKGQSPLRIDKYLAQLTDKASRSRIQNAAEAGAISVNGKAVKANYKVKPLDEIVLVLPKPQHSFEVLAEQMPLDIVYEDDDVIVLNKPAGLVVHPGVGNYTGTLVNGLLYHFQNLPINQSGSGLSVAAEQRPGLVHRIDKNTTGLMVVAKNEYAMTHLAKQFFDHSVVRRYVALVWGDVLQNEGTIVGNIDRHQRFRKLMDVYPPEEGIGKHAVTHYEVLERFGYVTLVSCRLETGRTHQIRVHFQHIGHSLFNDPEYDGDRIRKGTVYTKYKQFVDNCFSLIPRQALHAKILGFVHPTSGKQLYFESELPDDMVQVLDKWRKYRSNHIEPDTTETIVLKD